MRVTAYDPYAGDELFRDLGVERGAELDDVLAAADFLTLHSPLTPETEDLIDRDAITRMKDGARIVNAARGGLVDEDALVEAIRSGKLAGAALDVFSAEPYTGPLLELDEVVVTPHLAASTDEAQDRAGVIIAEQIVAALEGGLVTNAVNIPIVDQEDLEVLGPYIPLAARLGKLAVDLLGGVAAEDRRRRPRPARRIRHAPADGCSAERRVRGASGPCRERRQRVGDRRRAWGGSGRGAVPRVAGLHEPRRGAGRGGRSRDGRVGDDDRP